MENAEVTRHGVFDCQVCVPFDWSDEQVTEFANRENLCRTTYTCQIRREGNEALGGDPERNPCSDRVGFVHIILDA